MTAFTSAEEIKVLLGLDPGISISTTFLEMCDRWVRTQMHGRNLDEPETPDDNMKAAGAYIGCAFYVDSMESKTSWFSSISYSGGSFKWGTAAQDWERRANKVIDAISTGTDIHIEALTYFDSDTTDVTYVVRPSTDKRIYPDYP